MRGCNDDMRGTVRQPPAVGVEVALGSCERVETLPHQRWQELGRLSASSAA